MSADKNNWHSATKLVHMGRNPADQEGAVNPPIQRGSTIIIPKVKDLYRDDMRTYGLEGFNLSDNLAASLAEMAGGTHAILAPSGLSALTLAMLTFLSAGDEILISDSAYGPTRRFADQFLARFGVSAAYFDPENIQSAADAITPATKMMILESPGSLTFEISDVPALVKLAKAKGIITLIDDTWSAGLYYKPLAHGVDISMQALTKYQGGHADVLAGALVVADKRHAQKLALTHRQLGLGVAPEECNLVLRGLRTISLRMAAQDISARKIATFLEARPEVDKIFHPALPSHPGHQIWARDFTGAGGLFSFTLKNQYRPKLERFLEGLSLFSMGFSWGGFESLILPCDPQIKRTAKQWDRNNGPLLRISAGLEHVDDLIADLAKGLEGLSG